MKYLVIGVRTLLGLGFLIFGLNAFLQFMPAPPTPPDSLVGMFMTLFGTTHWMWLVGAAQVAGGLLILAGRTAPLGLAVLAPVLVNILAFHVFVTNGEGLAPGLIFSAFEAFLIYVYRDYFAGLFTTSAKPRI